jgi:hypothetical protein
MSMIPAPLATPAVVSNKPTSMPVLPAGKAAMGQEITSPGTAVVSSEMGAPFLVQAVSARLVAAVFGIGP